MDNQSRAVKFAYGVREFIRMYGKYGDELTEKLTEEFDTIARAAEAKVRAKYDNKTPEQVRALVEAAKKVADIECFNCRLEYRQKHSGAERSDCPEQACVYYELIHRYAPWEVK